MTTIAWDGKTLAADRLMSSDNLRRTITKLFVSKEYAYGGCGAIANVMSVADWVLGGLVDEEKPELNDDPGELGILVHRKSGTAFLVEGKSVRLIPVEASFESAGSGREFALTAMRLGQSAREAIATASEFDIFTGGGVDAVDVTPKRRGRSRK